ncbi:extracellular solute-binding protein [Pelagovum pacificum]|uniref:Extracellular solute-binding protein n=1 Tax=Pelagovum pacificum TaxID=2588711 RepID=A0A5C5GJU8_9RHOB|nr:extracellular solute-binding protein [Pelagovum pacificum]QQA43121.1 extracellular solute-binding protein [Pelagovum pacificum]TNY33736.1 extracellular solute-binding protein [Pelagovum pacificum]
MTAKTTFRLAALCSAIAVPAMAQDDLVTRNRVGPADAPNAMTFRLTAFDLYAQDPEMSATFGDLFIEMLEDFPDWRIDTQLQTNDIGQEQARMLEQARSGRGPDCAMIDSSSLGAYKAAGVLSPMNDYFSEEDIADLFPFVREGVTDDEGNLLAYWWFTDLRVMYRDTRVVPEAPQTWDEAMAAGQASADAGYEGLLFSGGRWEGTALDWLGNFWAAGGNLVDEDGRPVFGEGENREAFVEALTYYADLVESGASPSRVASVTNYDDFLAAAAAGSTAMFVGGSWQYEQLRATLAEEDFEAWEVSELPGPTADQRAAGAGGWTIGAMSDDPEKVELCAAIAKLYAGPGNVVQGLLPTATAYYEEAEIFSTPTNLAYSEFLENGRPRPGVAVYPEIANQIQIAIGDVLTGGDPEAATDTAQEAALAAYERL